MTPEPRPPLVARDTLVTTTFVEIVEALVHDFDIVDVLTTLTTRCVDLLDAAAAGILLADGTGRLRVIGASTDQVEALELFQIQNEEGPCLDCYTTGKVVAANDLVAASPWPSFATRCSSAGYASVYAVPLRFNSEILGCLNLFMTAVSGLSVAEVALAQALADVATLAIAQSESHREPGIAGDRLQRALDGRIAIEQAKGMIAEHAGIDLHDAFQVLRTFARDNHRALTEVADALVAAQIDIGRFQPLESMVTSPLHEPTAFGRIVVEAGRRVLYVSGDLDLSTRERLAAACLDGDGVDVIDLTSVAFMDCAAYGALVSARAAIEIRGGALDVRNAHGQPAALLALIAKTDANGVGDARDRVELREQR
jgi:anti-anti-sigma factor